jgi:hypothetical protein
LGALEQEDHRLTASNLDKLNAPPAADTDAVMAE